MTAVPPPLVPRRIRGLIFDLDGTLVDSYLAIARGVNAARQAHGLPPMEVEEVRLRVGHGLAQLMEHLVGVDHAESGAAVFRACYESTYLDTTVALPGARETLLALRARGYRLSVASNKPAYFCVPILERLGLLAGLDAVEGPETAGAPKPDPRMLRRCLAAMEVAPEEAAYIGDMALDVESAAAAGVASILVAGGSTPVDALRRTGQTLVGALPELLALLPAAP